MATNQRRRQSKGGVWIHHFFGDLLIAIHQERFLKRNFGLHLMIRKPSESALQIFEIWMPDDMAQIALIVPSMKTN